ncbi:MAG: polysaccharide biosynthesis tyrosine autokinase [Lentisphaerae bacterium]|nr:polysaccharide biosynthesis tyrosine autokinase [Lentisphaerota bacterium]
MDKTTSNERGPEGESLVLFYLGVIRRRFWVIIPIVVVFGTVGLIRAFRTPPRYEATAKLIVQQASQQVLPFERGGDERTRGNDDFYTTQTELLRSRVVMDLALKDDRVKRYLEEEAQLSGANSSFRSELRRSVLSLLGATPAPPPALWERLRDHLRSTHIKDSELIEVTADFDTPHRAARIANAVAEAYDSYHKQRQVAQLGEAFEMLQTEKLQVQESLQKAERELQSFREKAQGVTVSAQDDNDPASERLVTLNGQLTEVQLKRIELGSQLAVMHSVYNAAEPAQLANGEQLFALPIIQSDRALADFRLSIATAEKELSTVAQVYGSKHPLYEEARGRLELLRDQFRKSLNEVILAQANQLTMLETQERDLQTKYEEQKQVVLSLSKESFESTRLRNEVARYQRLFDSLVERMGQVDISSGLVRTNVQIIEQASVPARPAGPGRMQAVLLAICLGLFFGVGLAFLFENLDDSIRTPEDLKERLDVPLLGLVPVLQPPGEAADPATGAPAKDLFSPRETLGRLATLAKRFGQRFSREQFALPVGEPDEATNARRAYSATLMLTEPNSSPAESYRAIRANLFYSRPADTVRTLCVTSSRPQEGKTTTTCNLAIAIAQTGKKVLLIDADLHRPQIGRALGLASTAGLTSVLVGETQWRDSIQKININGATADMLDIMTAGPSSPSPSELLGSTKMRTFLEEVRPHYDWVLIDTPPVLFVSDTAALGVHCDGVLLVVKSGDSSRAMITRAVESLAAVHIKLLGAILNNVVVSKVGRYYSSYYHVGYSRYARDYKSTYYASDSDGDDVLLDAPGRTGEGASASAPGDKAAKSSPAPDAPPRPAAPPSKSAPPAATPEPAAPWLDELAFLPVVWRARRHLDAGRRAAARADLRSLIARRTRLGAAWDLFLDLAVESRDSDAIRTAVKQLGNGATTHQRHRYALALGHLAFLAENPALAERYYREAAGQRPRDPAILVALTRVAGRLGNRAKLREQADELVRLAPAQAYGHYVQATLLAAEGQPDQAEKALRKSLSLRRTADALNDLAVLLAKRGALAEAEQMARAALAVDAPDERLWLTLGDILRQANRGADAMVALEQALALHPQQATTLLALIELYSQQGDAAKVRELDKRIRACQNRLSSDEHVRLGAIRNQFRSK